MSEPILYGIENCDQVRLARKWLREHGIAVRFHDLRRDGLHRDRVRAWLTQQPWDRLVNRRGLAWRKLDARQRDAVTDADSALAVLLAEPLLVKRPVLEHRSGLLIGFSEADYLNTFGDHTP